MNTATLCETLPRPFPNFSVVTSIRRRQTDSQSTRQLQQILDLVPQQMFMLEADWSAFFENQVAREYTGPVEALSPKVDARSSTEAS